ISCADAELPLSTSITTTTVGGDQYRHDDDAIEDCRALRARERAERASFADDIPRLLVLAQADKFGMSQMVVGGPFEELELADELRLHPLAFGHLCFRQPLTPTPAPRLRQIRKRALIDLEPFEPSEQLR